jgi:HSP20 family molecular chaperone IbpA
MAALSLLRDLRPFIRLLDEPLARSPAYLGAAPSRNVRFAPPHFAPPRMQLEMTEDGGRYLVEAELPGVAKADLQVSVGDGGRSLTINGTRQPRRARTAQASSPASEDAAGAVKGELLVSSMVC